MRSMPINQSCMYFEGRKGLFVNITLGPTGEVAGDATQVQSANEKNLIDPIRHHSDVGGS